MNDKTYERNELLAGRVIKGLESRNIKGHYAADRQDALKIALEIIPEGSKITMGGCTSAHEIGLIKALKSGNYNYIDRDEWEDRKAAQLQQFDSDVFISSANAMTEDGIMVNIDGNGNRVAAIAYGPEKVIFIVGMNKICRDIDAAVSRARNTAAPINTQRFDVSTPCKKTGACYDCLSTESSCCEFLITRCSRTPERMEVILVNDTLGF